MPNASVWVIQREKEVGPVFSNMVALGAYVDEALPCGLENSLEREVEGGVEFLDEGAGVYVRAWRLPVLDVNANKSGEVTGSLPAENTVDGLSSVDLTVVHVALGCMLVDPSLAPEVRRRAAEILERLEARFPWLRS